MKRVFITGPESSGKSTLYQYLKRELKVVGVAEYAREYLEEKGGDYTFEDLKIISNTQLSLCQSERIEGLLLCDTGALVLKIWAEERFQKTIEIVERELKKNTDDLYLLCKPDIPWEEDPLRENPEDRERLFEKYLNYLKEYKLNYRIISGGEEERNRMVKGFIRIPAGTSTSTLQIFRIPAIVHRVYLQDDH